MNNKIRKFESGASRDTNNGKFEYLGFMHPLCDYSFAKYMHEHRKMSDGSLRDSNNWWGGFGKEATIQSLVRHVEDLKALHCGYDVYELRYKDGSVKKEIIKNGTDPIIPNDVDKIITITEEDCCNAIRFGAQAYLLELLK